MHKINVLVAEALGLVTEGPWGAAEVAVCAGVTGEGDMCGYDWCRDPTDYMALAIEHGIGVIYLADIVYTIRKVRNTYGYNDDVYGPEHPKEQTGLAVCQAYLMSKGVEF